MAKNNTNWELIYSDYRTGRFSNRALGKKHNISEAAIRKKVKKEGWEKDLLDAYQKELENTLIEDDSEEKQDSTQCEPEESTQDAPEVKHKSDDEREYDRNIVKEAAKVGAEVVREHRRDIKNLKQMASKIGSIVGGLLSDDEEERKKAAELFAPLTSHTETITDVTRKLASIHSECIKLERVAFNMDSKEGGKRLTINTTPTKIVVIGIKPDDKPTD